jgi:hypothetical protein
LAEQHRRRRGAVVGSSRETRWAYGTAAVLTVVLGLGIVRGISGAFDPGDPTAVPTAAPSPSTLAGGVALALTADDANGTPAALSTATPTPTAAPTLSPSPTPARAATVTPTPTPNVRKVTSAELTLVLRGQIEAQRAQFQDGKVRYAVPDKVVITGSAPIGGRPTQVEADLTVGIDANGRPRILAYKLQLASGQPAPPEAQAALAARVTQTNSELDNLLPRTQRARRVWVTNNPDTLWAEVE